MSFVRKLFLDGCFGGETRYDDINYATKRASSGPKIQLRPNLVYENKNTDQHNITKYNDFLPLVPEDFLSQLGYFEL